ncbi:MAG: MucBP domain-containing protein, partial [Oscillospiraceae bacterium]|nr:MucBP domain-containing protein [Oscillospiraceae bacterium]
MAKKTNKRMGRKFLSVLLALVLVIGLIPMSTLAVEGYSDQVMDGYFTVDASGNAVSGAEAVVNEEGFTLSKTIEQTGVNEFEITLTVETSQTVVPGEAAIALVIDTSSSMQYCGECGSSNCRQRGHNTNRLEAVQEILTGNGNFLDSLKEANTGKVLVTVVSYGKDAKTVCEWVDIKTDAGMTAVKNAINTLRSVDNATNTHAGLSLAYNRLNMSDVANAAVKFTVLLSDGMANCVGEKSNSTSTIKLTGRTPSSANATTEGTESAADKAAELSELGTVYAVGYGVEKNYLDGIIGNSRNVFVGADKDTVTAAFANIAQSATEGMDGAGTSVVDPMGDYIVLGSVVGIPGVSASNAVGGLVWSLNPANARTFTEGNTTTYTYSVTYPVTLDTDADGFEENVYYPTNGYTYLSVPQESGAAKQIAFSVPGVCGELPSYTLTVNWMDDMGEYLASTHTEVLKKGSEYTTEEKPFENYSLTDVIGETEGVITGNTEVTYVYLYEEPESTDSLSYTLTVRWIDDEGNSLDAPYEETYDEGAEYTTEEKSFENYSLVEIIGAAVGIIESDTEVIYVYTYEEPAPETYTLTVSWIDEEGAALAETFVATYEAGAEYTTEEKSFENYSLVEVIGAAAGIIESDTEVIYVYTYEEPTP